MKTALAFNQALAASTAGIALAALLAAPARAGVPLGYQDTEITNAQLGAASSRTVGISNMGVVAGIYDINGPGVPPFTAYLYDTHGGAVTDVNYQTANGGGPEFDSISSDGSKVLGDYGDLAGNIHYFSYGNGQAVNLPDPAGISNNYLNFGPNYSYYTGINNSGALTGYFSADGGASEQSFLLQNGQTTTFSVPGANAAFTEAFGINAFGTIAGTYYNSDFSQANGFIRAADGTFATFDVPNATNTYLQGTSDNGNLFGFFETAAGKYENFTDLNGTFIEGFRVAGSMDTEVTGINDSGEISGFFVDADNTHHSFYAMPSPVPEADTHISLGLGLLALVPLAFRRRAANRV